MHPIAPGMVIIHANAGPKWAKRIRGPSCIELHKSAQLEGAGRCIAVCVGSFSLAPRLKLAWCTEHTIRIRTKKILDQPITIKEVMACWSSGEKLCQWLAPTFKKHPLHISGSIFLQPAGRLTLNGRSKLKLGIQKWPALHST